MIYREIAKRLTNDGWIVVRSCGSHYTYKKEGYREIITIPDHGNKDISIGVIKNAERVSGLTLRG